MITLAYARTLALYNRAMNERLYAVCAELSDEERKLERGAFFGSIHGTLNHLLWADALAVARFTGQPLPASSPRTEMHAEFEPLRAHRFQIDAQLVDLAARLVQPMLDAPSTVTSMSSGKQRTFPVGLWITHLFNHQTHHRGQVSTLLSQAGKDLGVTDLPWLDVDYGP